MGLDYTTLESAQLEANPDNRHWVIVETTTDDGKFYHLCDGADTLIKNGLDHNTITDSWYYVHVQPGVETPYWAHVGIPDWDFPDFNQRLNAATEKGNK